MRINLNPPALLARSLTRTVARQTSKKSDTRSQKSNISIQNYDRKMIGRRSSSKSAKSQKNVRSLRSRSSSKKDRLSSGMGKADRVRTHERLNLPGTHATGPSPIARSPIGQFSRIVSTKSSKLVSQPARTNEDLIQVSHSSAAKEQLCRPARVSRDTVSPSFCDSL